MNKSCIKLGEGQLKPEGCSIMHSFYNKHILQ